MTTWTSRTFVLPWPPAGVSPNARGHWSRLHKAKKRYRRTCWITALEQLNQLRPRVQCLPPPAVKQFRITIEFRPPQEHVQYDRDNLIARMKSGIDGVCDALDIDDARFGFPEGRMGPVVKGGAVVVEVAVPATEGAS